MTDVQPQPGAPPAPPANAVEARARLDTLIANKDWGAKLLNGDAGTNREYRDLLNMAEKADASKIAVAMSGDIGEMPDSSVKIMAETASMLREIGIREEVIEQTLQGHEVSQKEYDLVKAWHSRQMKDPVFVKAYLSGDPVAREKMMLAHIVLSSDVKGALGSF